LGSATPSECASTYDWFCTDLRNFGKNVPLQRKIILSDEGSGVKKFCRKSSFHGRLLHLFYHRHLIPAFGAFGLLCQLVQQAQETQSRDICLRLRPQLLRTAREAFTEKTTPFASFYRRISRMVYGIALVKGLRGAATMLSVSMVLLILGSRAAEPYGKVCG
jgi:hypothetical protein